VSYILASLVVPDQKRAYYAGPSRKIGSRMAHKITHSCENATKFPTREEADAMHQELGDGYEVVICAD
jgi:hypothetical protein